MKPSGEALRFMQRLWDLAHALEVRSKHMAKDLGVTSQQRLVIRVVGLEPGMTAREISATMNIHPSTLTGVLARLEKQGMLVRTVDPEDRRRAHFDLTAAGQRVDRERKGTVEAAVRRSLARADDGTVARTEEMLALLVTELGREDS
jgi:DNA-binding MarR family transcriptional regulator